jgi:tetratricopeptide (TPR) repeat protein
MAQLPYSEFIEGYGRKVGGYVVYNYGALQSLERLSGLLHDEGFILINDYGTTEVAVSKDDFEHQRFSGSTAVGLNFAMLKTYFDRSRDRRWIEPAEENPHIHSRLLGRPGIASQVVELFQDRFSKKTFDAVRAPAEAARELVKAGRYEAAASAYREALQRQPKNWMLMDEVAQFLTCGFQDPARGLEMARVGLAFNPSCSANLWNTLGDSLFGLGRVEDARDAFLRALKINPSDVRARYNLACLHVHRKDTAAALATIAEGLAIDEAGVYRQGFLQKQTEVFAQIAQRHQQEGRLRANRVRRLGGPPAVQANGTADAAGPPNSARPQRTP